MRVAKHIFQRDAVHFGRCAQGIDETGLEVGGRRQGLADLDHNTRVAPAIQSTQSVNVPPISTPTTYRTRFLSDRT